MCLKVAGSRAAALDLQRQSDRSFSDGHHRQSNVLNALTHDGQHRQADFYGGMICIDLWYWLINHCVSRHRVDKKSTSFLFHLYTCEIKETNERKPTLDGGKRDSQPVSPFPDLN